MNRLLRPLMVFMLILSISVQAQKRYANQSDMGKLYQALSQAVTLPSDREAALGLANTSVVLELDINKAGKLIGVEVLEGTNTAIDNRLVGAMKKFKKWNPSTLNGSPIDDKVKFNMYFNDICELRAGYLRAPVPEVTINDLGRYIAQNILPMLGDKLNNEGGRMAISLKANNNGEVKEAELISFFAHNCSKQIEELLTKTSVRMPRQDSGSDRMRYFEFRFLATKVDGKYTVQKYTEARPMGGFVAFNKYINSKVDGKQLERFNVLEAQFDVDTDGTIRDVTMKRGEGALGDRYKKALESAPRWFAATVDGKSVKVSQLSGFKSWKDGTLITYWEKSGEFPGGDQALAKYAKKHLDKYKTEIQNTIKPDEKVRVKWMVDIDGNLRKYEVLSGTNAHVMRAIEDMAEDMPQWIGHKVNGVHTTAYYTQTIDLHNYKNNK